MRLLVRGSGGKPPLKFAAPVTDKPVVDDLTREFLLESQEGLDRMERCLTDLEVRPGDRELLAEIFRSVHTIKGTTGFLGFGRLEKLSHAGENLLGLLRDGQLEASSEIISALLALMDGLRAILRSIEVNGAEGAGGDADGALVARLAALQAGGDRTLTAAAELPGTAPAAELPSPIDPRARKRRSGSAPRSGKLSSPAPGRATAAPGEAGPQSPAELPADGEEHGSSPDSLSPQAGEGSPGGRPEADLAAAADTPRTGATADSTLRVDVQLLNRMMNLVGELVLTRNQILQATAADAGFAQLGRRLDMVTADLREAVMRARMQPVSHVFSRFPRLVRDLSHALGKRVRLELEGQETELDKSLLEAIRDPLTHAIRNAIDHGIELPEVRVAGGKPPEGVVRLRACHEGSHVIIETEDDGAGMNIERIREKAVERQLVPAARAGQMGEREILQLIFLPGFTTASQVTSVSGRGVGMDVVRTNVEKIGGKVEIDSRPGQGTILRLRIPLTLAIVPALIVRSGGENFAVPQSALTELVHLSAGDAGNRIEWLESTALYRLRGRLLPLIFLDRLLQQPERPPDKACDIAVLNADGRRFGLVVDGLADPEEIVVKPLAAVLRSIGYYAGATILGNARMALILNPGAIAQSAGIPLSGESEEEQAAETMADRHEFLVVEAEGGRAALPLKTVVRIERIPRSRIEEIDSRPVLRFDSALLPLDDAAARPAGGDPESLTTVVVCRDGKRQVGVTVSEVLDVADGERLAEAGSGAVAGGVTLLLDRVTRIARLGGIPSLGREASQPVDSLEEALR